MQKDIRNNIDKKTKENLTAFILGLGQQSRSIIQEITKTNYTPTVKADKSLVTEADIKIEKVFREKIQNLYPNHGIIGEEFPAYQEENEFVWLLDPIDGTEEFVYGVPTYGSIISLLYQHKPLITLIDNQALNLQTLAVYGEGLKTNGDKVIDYKSFLPLPTDLRSSRLAISKKTNFQRLGDETQIFDVLTNEFPNVRIFDSCFAYASVAHGMLHAMLDVNIRSWDILGTELLCTEQAMAFNLLRDSQQGLHKSRYSVAFGQPALVEHISSIFKEYTK